VVSLVSLFTAVDAQEENYNADTAKLVFKYRNVSIVYRVKFNGHSEITQGKKGDLDLYHGAIKNVTEYLYLPSVRQDGNWKKEIILTQSLI
jgi:hypothetical protein